MILVILAIAIVLSAKYVIDEIERERRADAEREAWMKEAELIIRRIEELRKDATQ